MNGKCTHCKKREIEDDSLFTQLCKKCSGQEDLELRIRQERNAEVKQAIDEKNRSKQKEVYERYMNSKSCSYLNLQSIIVEFSEELKKELGLDANDSGGEKE